MIDLTEFAATLSTALTALSAETLPNTAFYVAPDVGKFKRAKRTGNTVTNYINCLLTSRPSANETANNGLVIAIDQMTLSVAVPLDAIRTAPTETPLGWQDGINQYVATVKGIINAYFAVNNTSQITDGDTTYTVGWQYATSATGESDFLPMADEFITFDVYITANVVENGLNSLSVAISVDGVRVGYQSASPNRSAIVSANVFSNDSASKAINTGTAYALDISAPATSSISAAGEWLIGGESNIAHFVGLTYAGQTQYKLMTYNNAQASSQGVTNVGESYGLVEISPLMGLVNFSDLCTVNMIQVTSATGTQTVTAPAGTETYIALLPDGSITEMDGGASLTVNYDETTCYYDGTNYYVYFVTCVKEA